MDQTPEALHAKIGRLEQQLTTSDESLKQANKALKDAGDKYTALEKTHNEFKAASDASPHAKQVTALKAEVAGLKHRDAFAKAARAKGVDPDRADDLYDLGKLKPGEGGEEGADGEFDEYLESARTSRGWAFSKAESAAEAGTTTTHARPPGPGNRRGPEAPREGAGKLPFTPEQMRDPAFMARNAALISKTLADRNAAQPR